MLKIKKNIKKILTQICVFLKKRLKQNFRKHIYDVFKHIYDVFMELLKTKECSFITGNRFQIRTPH
jgi:hypothetical protein